MIVVVVVIIIIIVAILFKLVIVIMMVIIILITIIIVISSFGHYALRSWTQTGGARLVYPITVCYHVMLYYVLYVYATACKCYVIQYHIIVYNYSMA